MKPGKLYIKIFFSFLVILIITEILVFGLFMFTAGRIFKDRIEKYTNGKITIARQMVEDRIKEYPDTALSDNEPLKKQISQFAEAFSVRIWLADPAGRVLVKSFTGQIPNEIINAYQDEMRVYKNYSISHAFRRGHEAFATIPIKIREGTQGSLNILFDRIEKPRPEGTFGLGLIAIGIVIAILIIPLSRLITKPLKELKHSSMSIADGNLSHRTSVNTKDEIGELGRSFNRMAEKIERMVRGGKELTANISHELRSPLTRIRIAEELLRSRWEASDGSDFERLLNNIREDINELDLLIGRILELSKLDIHEIPLKIESIEPSDLIIEMLERLHPVIKRRNLVVSTEFSKSTSIYAEKEALRSALTNILDNAVKFTPKGGSVFIVLKPSDHNFLQISVTNSSEALTEKDLNSIFEPFYRTDKPLASGSGLGLAIARKNIERHNGSIKAFNTKNGFKIEIKIPVSNKAGINQS